MKIGIIGAGGWGTALAFLLSQNNHEVILWDRDYAVVEEINRHHTNNDYLPGFIIPNSIRATNSAQLLADAEMIVVAVPTQFIRPTFEQNSFQVENKIVVSVSKGIERGTLLRVSEILQDVGGVLLENFATLTGPSHAEEVSRLIPTTVMVASEHKSVSQIVQTSFTTPNFRVYYSNDLIGAEFGGALKNVMAISSGIIDGLGFGDNTKAALVTRGLAEMMRLGIAAGANPQTFSGLSGLGDLVVTCFSKHSRNNRLGFAIGQGKPLSEILAETKQVAEGVGTADSAVQLSRKYGVEMPIAEQVYSVLFEGKSPIFAMQELMSRESKAEYLG